MEDLVTDFDPEHLRSIAEAANDGEWEVYPHGQKKGRVDFLETFDPPTVIALLDELAAQRIERQRRNGVFVEVISDYERLRGYMALRHDDNIGNSETAQWLADNGHGLFVEGVPEADDWRERYWPETASSAPTEIPPGASNPWTEEADEITEIIYEDALIEGEPWAEESHAYRADALKTNEAGT
jgi:hypothetical protein